MAGEVKSEIAELEPTVGSHERTEPIPMDRARFEETVMAATSQGEVLAALDARAVGGSIITDNGESMSVEALKEAMKGFDLTDETKEFPLGVVGDALRRIAHLEALLQK